MSFLGLTGTAASYEDSRVVIVPVPYEYSACSGHGTGQGPAAILTASSQIECYDEYFGTETWRPSLATVADVTVAGPPDALAATLRERIGAILDHGKIPLCLGGEHSISLGPVTAAHERFSDLTVLSLDAHADLRARYGGLALSHATVMRRAAEICPVAVAGVRSISQEEVDFLAGEGDRIAVFYRRRLQHPADGAEKIIEALGEHVYLSIDVDVLDPGLLPATGTPEPGGLSWDEINDLLARIAAERTLVAADLVEFAPRFGDHTSGAIVARLAYRIVGFLARGA